MVYNYVIDSYAWVEYFKGTKRGEIAKEFIETKENATASIIITELSEKYERENKSFEEDMQFILSRTKIVPLNAEIALESGKVNCVNKKKIKNWGMADAIILATANILGAKVVTGDEHFRNLNSIMLDA